MNKKLLNFTNAEVADVKYLNPLFSTCSIKVMYHGENRNMTTISKEAVEKALPSIFGIPIVGEYASEEEDYKGHGGEIDLDTMTIKKTTRPYGYVPDDATYRWEKKKIIGTNQEVEYLILEGCRLWTGNYPEAYDILNGKGQSMEIIVEEGQWNENTKSYEIEDFLFSALCVLGDAVEPCFEGANIATSYSEDSRFQKEFLRMLEEDANASVYSKEENNLKLKDLLEKYSTNMKELTAKGLVFEDVAEENLEAEIAKALGVDVINEGDENGEFAKGKKKDDEDKKSDNEDDDANDDGEDKSKEDDSEDKSDDKSDDSKDDKDDEDEDKKKKKFEENDSKEDWISPEALQEIEKGHQEKFEALEKDYNKLVEESNAKDENLKELTEFKKNVEKEAHESKASELFEDFQLSEEDVQELDIHEFTLEELEGKCYEIFGRKMKESKTFSKKQGSTKVGFLGNKDNKEKKEKSSVDLLMEKYGNKK